jgi:hypothetical protein
MEREQDKTDFDTADIWRRAQQRREEDIGTCIANYFEKRRLKAASTTAPYPEGHPVPR